MELFVPNQKQNYLSSMRIYCDSNQKKDKHIAKENYFNEQGYTIIRQRLKVGDYMLDLNDKISVDTKQNMEELCSNLFDKEDSKRFIRECIRAKKNHIKLVFLIEEPITEETIPNITLGNAEHKMIIKSSQIKERIKYFKKIYGVRFLFCAKDRVGAKIIDVLRNGE